MPGAPVEPQPAVFEPGLALHLFKSAENGSHTRDGCRAGSPGRRRRRPDAVLSFQQEFRDDVDIRLPNGFFSGCLFHKGHIQEVDVVVIQYRSGRLPGFPLRIMPLMRRISAVSACSGSFCPENPSYWYTGSLHFATTSLSPLTVSWRNSMKRSASWSWTAMLPEV